MDGISEEKKEKQKDELFGKLTSDNFVLIVAYLSSVGLKASYLSLLFHRIFFLLRLHMDVHHIMPLLLHRSPHQLAAGHGADGRRLVLRSLHREDLEGAHDGHQGARPPRETGEIHVGAEPVQISCNGRRDGAARCARRGRQSIDFTKDGGRGGRFFEEDEDDGVG